VKSLTFYLLSRTMSTESFLRFMLTKMKGAQSHSKWFGVWASTLHADGKFGGVLPSPPQGRARGEVTPPRVGPRTLANPQPTRVGKRGSRGRSPLAGGMGDVPFRPNPLTPFPAREGEKFGGVLPSPPQGMARGEVTPPRVGPRTPANPQPTRVGQGGPGGEAPWQGAWGMCPSDLTP
jgi:hypothetical protein